jgi:hypothetical protein
MGKLSITGVDDGCHKGMPMDEALQLVIEMNEWTWKRFKDDLRDVTPEEIDWRPLPQANTINAILKHLRVEAQWSLASLEHGEHSPYQHTASVQQLTDSIPLDFEMWSSGIRSACTTFHAPRNGR